MTSAHDVQDKEMIGQIFRMWIEVDGPSASLRRVDKHVTEGRGCIRCLQQENNHEWTF